MKIPEWAKYDLEEYVQKGTPVSSFLERILCNDLMGAMSRADDFNKHMMFEYCAYLYNKMPIASYGSEKNYKDWVKQGGYKGLTVGEKHGSH